ncbi:hypothetical protein ACFOU2_20855 [Bacillus songklensis]|uniref:Uncharacterized protein n=2 Tax=Bacillus songklensis TaxID=1069116 RepID=A0ABV8B7D6_9BACI
MNIQTSTKRERWMRRDLLDLECFRWETNSVMEKSILLEIEDLLIILIPGKSGEKGKKRMLYKIFHLVAR